MRRIDDDELRKIMLHILVDVAEFCDNNGIDYYLDAGTLLGAVRHKGFIPWDNDIDIGMLRPSFEKFKKIVASTNNKINNHLIVEFPEETLFPYVKVSDIRTKLIEYPDTHPESCYAYIDIFPKDGIDELCFRNKLLCKKIKACILLRWFNRHTIDYWKTKKGGIKKAFALCMDKIVRDRDFPLRIQQNIINKHIKKHPIEKCEYVTTLCNAEYDICAKKEYFEELALLDFEQHKFKAPAKHHEWLRIKYGKDYMELPPEDKREIHNVEAYII